VSGDFSQIHSCGSSLAAGSNCTISVTFKPIQIGIRNGALSIADTWPSAQESGHCTAENFKRMKVNTNSASESPIRVYVLEQNRLLREAFVQLLRKRSSLTAVGDSDDCPEAYEELTVIQCDVLLLNSQEILQAIRQKAETAACLKQTKLLLFGMKEDPKCFLQAVRLGASGYLLNEASSTEIIAAVTGVAQGEATCPPTLCKSLFDHLSKRLLLTSEKAETRGRPANDLTCRQRQLMALVAKGMTNKEIASSLELSEFTVKNHIRRVMSHLQANSRHAAVDAIRTGGLFLSA
jgi:DNA-binding NarL/FixJ family response regulator